ncbi:NAD-dependent epimerase/dehydratase family protein [Aurantimonas sp. VKM B-3413]|uniref:NAD-dependent epimerase/dehydratase family protein n=1 Tax=Aurantimonas sp. VKM B-3413 TaxID=2779401 RepID=UPI001E4E097C
MTGAAGFVGAALVRRLDALGVAVVASDLAGPAPDGKPLAPCDLTKAADVEALIGQAAPGTILHCGAVSGPMVMADRPLDIWRINALGTANILEAARRHGVSRVIACSTSEVYGSRSRGIVDEEVSPAPDNVYGASKAAAELAVLAYRREQGLGAVSVRLSWVYGPGRRTPTDLENLLRSGIEGRRVSLKGHPDDITHYLFVDDAVEGLVRVAMAEVLRHEIYNVTAGEGIPLGHVIETARSLLPGLEVELLGDGPAREGPSGFDGARAAADIAYRPLVDLQTGLCRYADFLRQSALSPAPGSDAR